MKIEIEWLEDEHDCDTCGWAYATGAKVKFHGDEVITMEPVAHCFGGSDYSPDTVYLAIIEKLGHEVINKEN